MAEIVYTKRWKYKNGKKTKNFAWQFRYYIGKDETGKRINISKSGFKTKDEAKEAAENLIYNIKHGRNHTETDLTFSGYLAKWIEATRIQKNLTTIEEYQKKINLYINNGIHKSRNKDLSVNAMALGLYPMVSLEKNILESFLKTMNMYGYSDKTIDTVRNIITSCFQYAYDNKDINYNPAIGLKYNINSESRLLPKNKNEHVYIPVDDWSKIINRFDSSTTAYLPLLLGYYCGLRLSETFALTWDDIDLDNGYLTVNKQIQWHKDSTRSANDKKAGNGTKAAGKGYWYFTAPKYQSYRTIKIGNKILLDALRQAKETKEKNIEKYDTHYLRFYTNRFIPANQKKDDFFPLTPITSSGTYEIDFVLVRENGDFITSRIMQHVSNVVRFKLELADYDYHSLRHTHATDLKDGGADMIYISNRLGHIKIKTTEDIYTNHLTASQIEKGDNVLMQLS